jgi:hypothetical protein
VDPALLAEAERRVRSEPPYLPPLLEVRGGDLVLEAYCGEQTAEAPLHVWSVTMSVIGMAVGIAIGEGR